jgi:site-specific recombinase XerD
LSQSSFTPNKTVTFSRVYKSKCSLDHLEGVPLDALTAKRLYAQNKRHVSEFLFLGDAVWQDTRFVFVAEKGELIHPDTVSRIYSKLQRKAALSYNRDFDTRHTNATELLRLGENLHVVAHSLGHRDASVPATNYAHVDTEQSLSASETFTSRMRGA